MKKTIITLLAACVLAVGAVPAAHAAEEKKAKKAANTAPKTLIHVVTVSWKAGTTPEQIKAALDGAHKLPAAFPGITRVWTRTVKAQGDRTHAIVMEFASEQALKEYSGSAAQKEWYKSYLSIRDVSTTFDISN